VLFNSLHFLIFFPVIVVIYFLLNHRYRWILLLAASYYFYMCWKPEYIALLLFSTLIDFYSAHYMSKTDNQRKRKLLLLLSLVTNLGMLFGFKYLNFFSASFHEVFQQFNIFRDSPVFHLILPVGISFYTFQSLTYTIDVYLKKMPPIQHVGIFCLYVSFFPQLVAGPIERSQDLLPQFTPKRVFNYERVSNGLKLMFWGFFQKIVIADNMSRFVNEVYAHPESYFGIDIALVTLFFAIQIYCDFSGYCDIAIGAAQILGIQLSANFKRPYFAHSIADFWRRWHITLTSWFRDYLYIALGGNRRSALRTKINVLITFLVSGLWHGANWTFVMWGTLHGIGFIVEKYIQLVLKRIKNATVLFFVNKTAIVITFLFVCFSWIFFRSASISDAFLLIKNLFFHFSINLSFDKLGIVINLLLISFLFIIHFIENKHNIVEFISSKAWYVRWPVYYFMFLILIGFGNFGVEQFIYFQF